MNKLRIKIFFIISFVLIIVCFFCYLILERKITTHFENSKYQMLFKSVLNENLKSIKLNKSLGLDFNIVSKKGVTPLMFALLNNKYKSFVSLIECGADINFLVEKKKSVILEAIKSNNLDKLKFCVENGANTNLLHEPEGNVNFRPINLALELGSFEMAKYLLENGVEMNITDQFNETAFSTAYLIHSIDREFRKILFLLDNNCNPYLSNEETKKTIINRVETSFATMNTSSSAYKEFLIVVERLEKLGFEFKHK